MEKELSLTKKFYTTAELFDLGFSYYKIAQLVEKGVLIKGKRGLYENAKYIGDENDFSNAQAYVPYGVVCLLSAARYYGLTEFLPDSIDLAIQRKKKVTSVPDWPSVNLYYFNDTRMNTGVDRVCEDGGSFYIYDLEKTVADIISYRNKVGIEETKEILKNYLKRPDRDIDKLYYYAKKVKCDNVLRSYLEVLL